MGRPADVTVPDGVWPLASLSLTSGPLTLRMPTTADAVPLMRGLSERPIVPPGRENWLPWLEQKRPPTVEGQALQFLQRQWVQWGSLSPAQWALDLIVIRDGQPLGLQSIRATCFQYTRVVRTGSWLIASAQGRGVGTHMRAMVLAFAFDHLRARYAMSAMSVDNRASAAVSARLGYRSNGFRIDESSLTFPRVNQVVLDVAGWHEGPGPAMVANLVATGVDACLPLLGAGRAQLERTGGTA